VSGLQAQAQPVVLEPATRTLLQHHSLELLIMGIVMLETC